MSALIGLAIGCGITLVAIEARSAEVKVAVAANFIEPAKELAQLFEKASGHKLTLSFGATGQFYAQIAQGAPFQVLLAADQATPRKAIAENLAIAGSNVTYATGRLVLFSRDKDRVKGEATLKDANFSKIAIANPSLAPYGAAAMQTMQALGVAELLKAKLVMGNTIAQTYQFIETGNAELGFVALSQVVGSDKGSRWIVPASLHAPIAQDAVLLKPGANDPAARGFLELLKSPQARSVIRKFGYAADG